MKTTAIIRRFSGVDNMSWIAFFTVLLLAVFGWNKAAAITIDFDNNLTGGTYTAGNLLEGSPSIGTQWVRSANTGVAGSAFKILAGVGADRNQGVTAQAGSGTITSANYTFSPSNTDLGGTFNATSSIVNYSFSVRFESAPNTSSVYLGRVHIGPTNYPAAEFDFWSNGQVKALNGSGGNGGTDIILKTTKGGATNFTPLGGVYFTYSGQVNYATHTYTVFLDGVAQTIAGPTATANFGFQNNSANTADITIQTDNTLTTGWIPFSVSHFECWLDPVWSAPITISTGGIYTGNWASTSATTPAVKITTSAPVTIQNSNIKGPYHLIYTANVNANLTVINCKGYGENPNVSGQQMPKFIYALDAQSLTAQKNYLESTAGMWMDGPSTSGGQSINITNNKAFLIDGRVSDGAGGYNTTVDVTSFFQLGSAHLLASGVVSWNQVIEVPNESRVEDSINFWDAGGSPGNPIKIFDNCIEGGYSYPVGSATYSGCGINCADGKSGDSLSTCSAYNSAYNNVVVNYGHSGTAILDGHDNTFYNNQDYSCGTVGVNTPNLSTQSAGIGLWDLYGTGTGVFFNNTATGNFVGWVNPGFNIPHTGEYDYYFPAYPAGVTANTWCSGTITAAVEQTAVNSWYSAVTLNGISVGPNW
jgi:hypothetical protein